jgi:hypothetical protein
MALTCSMSMGEGRFGECEGGDFDTRGLAVLLGWFGIALRRYRHCASCGPRRIKVPVLREGLHSAHCCSLSARYAPMRRRGGRWPGVRSPVHARGAPEVAHTAQRHQHQPSTAGARTPRMGPAPVPQATCPGTSGGAPRGAAPTIVAQGGGGAPGRRPHSRCPGCRRAWLVLMELDVAGRGGAPRAWAGERGHRQRPAARSQGGWGLRTRRRQVLLQRPRNSLKPCANACGCSWCSMWPAPARRSF